MGMIAYVMVMIVAIIVAIVLWFKIANCVYKGIKEIIKQYTSSKKSNTEELKKYKELLNDEIITQEEFDAKKKQLLDL